MAKTSTYLNFKRESEAAFTFYASVFGTQITSLTRFSDIPAMEGMPPLAEEDKNLLMNAQLPITGGHILMTTDAPDSMGFNLIQGNNHYIAVDPDTRAEAEQIFARLSEGGTVEMALSDQFWGDYFGSLIDKFGTRWMVNCSAKS